MTLSSLVKDFRLLIEKNSNSSNTMINFVDNMESKYSKQIMEKFRMIDQFIHEMNILREDLSNLVATEITNKVNAYS